MGRRMRASQFSATYRAEWLISFRQFQWMLLSIETFLYGHQPDATICVFPSKREVWLLREPKCIGGGAPLVVTGYSEMWSW